MKRLREEAGLSQAELAARVGIHQPNISRIERGGQMPGADIILSLAQALGVSPDEIYRQAGHLVKEGAGEYTTVTPLAELIELAARLDHQHQQLMVDIAEAMIIRCSDADGS